MKKLMVVVALLSSPAYGQLDPYYQTQQDREEMDYQQQEMSRAAYDAGAAAMQQADEIAEMRNEVDQQQYRLEEQQQEDYNAYMNMSPAAKMGGCC